MVLLSLIGLAIQVFLHVDVAFALGILVGFIAANFVPSETACPTKDKEHAGT